MKQFRVTLFIKSDKVNNYGLVQVYVKITFQNTHTTIGLDHWVDQNKWKQTKQFINTKALKEVHYRRKIDESINKLYLIEQRLASKGAQYSAHTIKNVFINGESAFLANYISLKELFQKHYKTYHPLVDTGTRAKESLRKFKTLENHVDDFLNYEYGLEDIPINQLNYQFIEAFDVFLRSLKKIGNNTTVKYIQSFKQLIKLAIKYDWLQKDPFALYNKKTKPVDIEFLNQEELKAIENLDLHERRLSVVRDYFVFSCYTGFAYADIIALKPQNIQLGLDNELWAIHKRKKTNIKCDIPLLPKAKSIIDKYRDDFDCIKTESILPPRSNQKINKYLKEIAEIAGITKRLHFHLARHTFSCTIILANGLSMEVLNKMLGHTNLKQTMHYGKIQNKRVSEEMKLLKEKLKQS